MRCLNTNFWMYWRTMFAFENWHSALEMKRYIQRYIHHIGGLPDFTALRFTRYNQYESMILPMVKLSGEATACSSTTTPRSVNVADLTCSRRRKAGYAHRHRCVDPAQATECIDLTENDLVFITNGGCVENSTHRQPEHRRPPIDPDDQGQGGGWDLWRQDCRAGPQLRPSGQVLL